MIFESRNEVFDDMPESTEPSSLRDWLGHRVVPQVAVGLTPTPASVIIADVASFCLNSLHAKVIRAVKGASLGILNVLKGLAGSDVSVTLN